MGRLISLPGALILALVFGLSCPEPAGAQEQPRTGGVLKVALIGEPPSLDLHWTTAVITQQVTWHVFETLFTYDRSYNPIPLLAEQHAVSEGGRRHTITLRRGVKFHNGKELTSADAVPSLVRWGKMSTPGKALWKSVESVEAKGPYEVAIHLKEPNNSLLYGLARPNNGAAIYPREVIDAAGDGQVKEFIGTGPYRFVEHKPDRHIKVIRFKDYVARNDLQVVDWATLVQRRNKPELYEIFSTGFTFNPDPGLATSVQCNWPGWWCHEEKDRLLEALAREGDPKKRRTIWERVQAIFYEDVGRIKFGDSFALDAGRKEFRGVQAVNELPLWNTWLAR